MIVYVLVLLLYRPNNSGGSFILSLGEGLGQHSIGFLT